MIEKKLTEVKTGHFKNVPVFKEDQPEGSKAIRAEDLNGLTVTIDNGKVFDADEMSQNRISRTIQALEFAGLTSTIWRLADNTDSEVTLDEFKEALLKSLEAQASLWFN